MEKRKACLRLQLHSAGLHQEPLPTHGEEKNFRRVAFSRAESRPKAPPRLRGRMRKIYEWERNLAILFLHSLLGFLKRGTFFSESGNYRAAASNQLSAYVINAARLPMRPSPVVLRATLSAPSPSPRPPWVSTSPLGVGEPDRVSLVPFILRVHWLLTCA